MNTITHFKHQPRNKGKLVGHMKLESTLRFHGVEVDDALEMSEHTKIWPYTRAVESIPSLSARSQTPRLISDPSH